MVSPVVIAINPLGDVIVVFQEVLEESVHAGTKREAVLTPNSVIR